MYARVATFESDPARLDDAIAMVRSEVDGEAPAGLEGAKMLMLIDRDTGKGLGITLFDSAEAMRRGDDALNAMDPGGSERRTSVEFYEVPVQTVSYVADVIDHVALRVSDLAASRAFYEAILETLGMRVLDTPDASAPQGRGVAFGRPGADDFWIHEPKDEPGRDRPTQGLHLAFRAANAEEVRAFYRAGLAAGGRTLGEPGPRPEYSDGYYGAFLLDPDGNNIEAVWHEQRE